MILQSILHLLPLWLFGFLLVILLWPGSLRNDLLLKLALGFGVGQGVDTCLYFFWIMVFGPYTRTLEIVEYILCALLFGMVVLNALRQPRINNKPKAPPILREWVILAGFATLLLASAVGFFLLTVTRPYGTFDAYAIWNLKARFMFLDPQHWQNAFSSALNWKTHPDYPLLIPLNVLRLWEQIGLEVPRAGSVIAATYVFGLVGLFFAAFYHLRDLGQAALAGIFLLATPSVLNIGTAQNADLPLAYYMLAAALLLYLAVLRPYRGYLLLCGLMAGLTSWTKNEGLIFMVILVLLAFVVWFRNPRNLVWLAIGMALPLVNVLIFKLNYAPPNDLIASQSMAALASKLFDLTRYRSILISFSLNLLSVGGWKLPILLIFTVIVLILRRQFSPHEKEAYRVFCYLVLITTMSYCGIYLITPHPLEWHLHYSFERLVLQVFPMILCLPLLGMRTPREWGSENHKTGNDTLPTQKATPNSQ